MTDTEASALVARIKHTWRGGPHADVWREVLLDLDAGTAGTCIVRLARDLDDAPSIAAFVRAYRSLHTVSNEPVPEPAPAASCDICGGTGFVTVTPARAHRASICSGIPGTPSCDCHASAPCSCSTGDRMRAVHRAVVEHNDRTRSPQLDEHGAPPPPHGEPEPEQARLDL